MADKLPVQDVAASEQVVDGATGTVDGKPVIAVKVYAPFQVYFEGSAFSISAVNATGPFDILPHHHNFLCMLVPCTLTIQSPGGPKSIKVSRALMHVKAESVVVFMDV